MKRSLVGEDPDFFKFRPGHTQDRAFEGLKHIPHWSAQSCNAGSSLCSFYWSARHFIEGHKRQSSAKRRTCEETVEERSKFNKIPGCFFFVLKIQKICFFKKKTTWRTWWHAGSAVYIIYILPKGQIYSYAWFCYIEMFFFQIDARSDSNSQGRFSRREVFLVGINLSSFNQFSLTECWHCFLKKGSSSS